MRNIGLKFKTVERGLAERFVFMPRPPNVFSLFKSLESPSLLLQHFASKSSISRFLHSILVRVNEVFSILHASEFYLSRREREKKTNSTISFRLGSFPPFDCILKIFNPLILVATERGKRCKRSFWDFFPLPPRPSSSQSVRMVMASGNLFDRLRYLLP